MQYANTRTANFRWVGWFVTGSVIRLIQRQTVLAYTAVLLGT
jgi:hypothetical protein